MGVYGILLRFKTERVQLICSTFFQNGAFAMSLVRLRRPRVCNVAREYHRLVDGASERGSSAPATARQAFRVRVSAAAAAQIVLQLPVVWPLTGGHAQLVAGAIETGQAAGEGVLGLARANCPRRHIATRRAAPAKRIASMDVALDMQPW